MYNIFGKLGDTPRGCPFYVSTDKPEMLIIIFMLLEGDTFLILFLSIYLSIYKTKYYQTYKTTKIKIGKMRAKN